LRDEVRDAVISVELRPAKEDENFLSAMLPEVVRDPRGRKFLGRLRGHIRGWAAQRENVRASLARHSKESMAILFLARHRIEMQAGHGAIVPSGPIRPFIQNNLLLARN
jgi:hypothetical protein